MPSTSLIMLLGFSFVALVLGVDGLFDMQRAYFNSQPMLDPLIRTGVFLLIAIVCVIGAAEAFLFFFRGDKRLTPPSQR